jgi:hypothetical protein
MSVGVIAGPGRIAVVFDLAAGLATLATRHRNEPPMRLWPVPPETAARTKYGRFPSGSCSGSAEGPHEAATDALIGGQGGAPGASIAVKPRRLGACSVASTPNKSSKKPATKKAPAKEKVAAKAPAKSRASRRRAPSHEAIAKRAYELSLADGGGDDVSHWLQAERELSGS